MTLGEADMLKGFVLTTVNKLPQVKPDLVRTDNNWQNWDMAAHIDEIREWLSRHNVDPRETGKVGAWLTSKGGKPATPVFCRKNHWRGDCKTVVF